MKTEYNLTASNCGYDGNLSSAKVFCLLQDAITVTLGKMGCSNIRLRDEFDSMWVFTKQKARVYHKPPFYEELHVNCRLVKANRLLCYAKTDITDSNGNLLIEGLTECCILDKKTFRFAKLTDFPLEVEEEDCDTDYDFEDFEPDFILPAKVTYSLTDMSGHLNNAMALNLIFDTFTIDEVKEIESSPFEIAIKYQNQAMHGKTLSIGKQKVDTGYLFKYYDEDKLYELGYIKKI